MTGSELVSSGVVAVGRLWDNAVLGGGHIVAGITHTNTQPQSMASTCPHHQRYACLLAGAGPGQICGPITHSADGVNSVDAADEVV